MELLQLRYFFESAKNENFAKTAQNHMVPTSSVSASVKRLEEELGCQLFDRASNRILLNENGRRLQGTLGAMFEELDSTVEALKSPTPPDTEIKLLILSLRERMTSAMIEYQRLHPNIRFTAMFNLANADPANYDLIVDKTVNTYTEHDHVELCSYPLCFRATKDSPLVGRELTMKDLRHERFITMEEEHEFDSTLFENCKKANFYPTIAVRTNDPIHYKYCTQAGLGISLWRKYDTPQPDGLVNLNVTNLQARQTMYLYYKRTQTNNQVKNFIEFLSTREF